MSYHTSSTLVAGVASGLAFLAGCGSTGGRPLVVQAQLGDDPAGFSALASAFEQNNDGYRLGWMDRLGSLDGAPGTRVVFVQEGECDAVCENMRASLRVGDIVIVRSGERLACEPSIEALVFTVPTPPPADVPTFIRPDFDPEITDTPGGCAEEEDAYRRILLTWQGSVGPYLYHAINAHRVRILDSFTHYHPAEGGFDEFYLVQDAPPGAELIVSEQLDVIQGVAAVTRDDVQDLLRRIPLRKGQLVYLPRTVVHRGLGGAVVQVITVPGFLPGAEIGVDAELGELNARFGLSGNSLLPVHQR